MHSYSTVPATTGLWNSIHQILRSFPIACFCLALATDIAYWQTANLLWLHFSEWLLLAGVSFGAIALVASLVDLLVRRVRPSWLAFLAGIVVLLLATFNNLVHTVDGWTAVVPYGLMLSALTVLAMIVTGVLANLGARHD